MFHLLWPVSSVKVKNIRWKGFEEVEEEEEMEEIEEAEAKMMTKEEDYKVRQFKNG